MSDSHRSSALIYDTVRCHGNPVGENLKTCNKFAHYKTGFLLAGSFYYIAGQFSNEIGYFQLIRQHKMIWFINYRLNIQELQCNIILYYLPAGAVDFFIQQQQSILLLIRGRRRRKHILRALRQQAATINSQKLGPP